LEANLDDNTGNLKLVSRYKNSTMDFPIISHNDLWFHTSINKTATHCPATEKQNNGKGSVIHKLSDAAQYELWHQRCGHRGQRTLHILHNHATGVPPLKGNAFWKCPSCLPNKLAIKIDHSKKDKQVNTCPETRIDDIIMPSTFPGQHFHMDFGFVRGSGFSHETIDGRTITSIDGFNSYLIVIDRCTRFTWIFLTTTKDPPIQQAQALLQKFKAAHKHRTVRVDQGKELGLSANFRNMLQEEGYALELTGSDSSNQNGIAERPNRTLAEMMRCMLHSANLGPGYWSYALTHAVYILNRMPHSSINKSPYEAMTKMKPDLTYLRIFGSRACAKKPGKRPYKLDTHAFNGIFLGYTATSKNVYIKDDKTNQVKIGSHVIFDEAHMSVPTNTAPLAAQALQRLGYHRDESWRKTEHSHNEQNLIAKIQLLSKTARLPTKETTSSIGYDVYNPRLEVTTIKPNETITIPLDIAIKPPMDSYCRVTSRNGLIIKKDITTLAGVINPDYKDNIHNKKYPVEKVVFFFSAQ